MESRAKLLGHPIHPMLVVVPLGTLTSAGLFDLVALVARRPALAAVAYWNIVVGLAGGLLAAVFGLRDWLAIPEGTRAKTVGLWHAAGNTAVVALFGTSLLLRRGDPHRRVGAVTVGLELLALAAGLVSAWLGNELVERLGVGVDEGAHLNAPNALFGGPAHEPAGSGVLASAGAARRDGAHAPAGTASASE